MRDTMLIVDVIQDFGHDDGEALLASFRERHDELAAMLSRARTSATPIVYANDNAGIWDGDVRTVVERALEGPGRDVVADLLPQPGDRFVLKPRYSAFVHTPLGLILDELECDRVLIAGATTEGCVAQTAIDARERGYKVSIVAAACATIDRDLEQTALRYLVDVVGAQLMEPEEVGGTTAG